MKKEDIAIARALVLADLLRQKEGWRPHTNISAHDKQRMGRQTNNRWHAHGRSVCRHATWSTLVDKALSPKQDTDKTDLEREFERMTRARV